MSPGKRAGHLVSTRNLAADCENRARLPSTGGEVFGWTILVTLRERGPGDDCALDLSAFRWCVEESSCLFRFFSVKPAIFVFLLVKFLGLRVQFVDDPRGNGGDGSAELGAVGCPGVPELFFCRPAVSMGDPPKRLHPLTALPTPQNDTSDRRHRAESYDSRQMSLSGNFNELEP